MICTECGIAEATGMEDSAVRELPDGPTVHTIKHLCGDCFAKIREVQVREHAAIQEQVRAAFADGAAFAQIRADLAPVIERAREHELREAAEYLDLVASLQPIPLPDDLQAFANRYRSASAPVT